MMTQTHILLAAGAFAKSGDKTRNVLVVAGSFVPDFALYALFAIARFQGNSPDVIFNQLYWSDSWQGAMAPGNSFLVFGLLAIVGFILMRGTWPRFGLLVTLFAASAFLHIATDFPLHVDDAHSHFWPISDWKFVSPISYWDDRYYAAWVRPVEFLIAIACLVILIRRFINKFIRIILALALVSYIAVPAYFYLYHHGG